MKKNINARREVALKNVERQLEEYKKALSKTKDPELIEMYEKKIDKNKHEREILLERLGKKPTKTYESVHDGHSTMLIPSTQE